MTREVCGMCWCPYGDDGRCACPVEEVASKPVAWIGETLIGRQYINGSNGSLPVGTALYTHPVKQLFNDLEDRDILIDQEFEAYVEVLTDEFKDGFREGVLFCEDVANRPALYGQKFHPVKQLSDERIAEIWEYAKQTALNTRGGIVELCFARAIIKEITE